MILVSQILTELQGKSQELLPQDQANILES